MNIYKQLVKVVMVGAFVLLGAGQSWAVPVSIEIHNGSGGGFGYYGGGSGGFTSGPGTGTHGGSGGGSSHVPASATGVSYTLANNGGPAGTGVARGGGNGSVTITWKK